MKQHLIIMQRIRDHSRENISARSSVKNKLFNLVTDWLNFPARVKAAHLPLVDCGKVRGQVFF
uniref:Uncharacterized protein n=1 Tax=Anguilla anguilla TaxID=7936 RepID=A0A0E9W9X7_ANGAN